MHLTQKTLLYLKVLFQRLCCNGFTILLLILWAWIFLQRAKPFLSAPVPPDAQFGYLPFARSLLKDGLSFFSLEQSIRVPPLAFIWPALFGANVEIIQIANLTAGLVMILLVYGIGRDVHSKIVGIISALLFAYSPFLVSWIPRPLSEAPFYLFSLIWLWATGKVLAGRKWAILIASVGLTLSILTRTIWLYPAIVLLLFLVALNFLRPSLFKSYRTLMLSLFLGLLVPLGLILRNYISYDLPALDTGAGGVLYYGTHLMTNGFEPPLLGLNYEDGGHGTLAGNRKHAAVAIQFLKERTWSGLFSWYFKKLSWVLTFTRLEAPLRLTQYRIAELTMTAVGIFWAIRKRNVLVLLLGAGIVIQVFQTAFALYNIRYSVDNVELVLAPLVAIGLVVLAQSLVTILRTWITAQKKVFDNLDLDHSPKEAYLSCFVAATSLMLFFGISWLSETPTIQLPPQIPYLTLFSAESTSPKNNVFEFNIPTQTSPTNPQNAIWKFDFSVFLEKAYKCPRAVVTFISNSRGTNRASGTATLNLRMDGQPRSYLLGTAMQNTGLFPSEPGRLVINLECTKKLNVGFVKAQLIIPKLIEKYFN